MKLIRLTAIVVLAVMLAGCSSYRAFQAAREFEIARDWDKAIEFYNKALEVDPGNKRYLASLRNAKMEASRIHFEKGKAFRAAGQPELAALEFELTVKLDPTNQFALVELSKTLDEVRARKLDQDQETIAEMKERSKRTTKVQPPTLNPASNEPISLNFPRETPIKEIYRALGNAFGINILFDPQVQDDRISIELRDVTAQQAIERVMQAGGHFYKVLDERTIIIVPDNPQTRRQYEDQVIQTFYLSNAKAEEVQNIVRTMLEARHVFPLPALNAITIRDTADRVRIAQEIIEANDKAKAEVVVQVELIQLDVTKAREIGMKLGGLRGAISAIDAEGTPIGKVTLDGLRSLGGDDFAFTMPSATYDFIKSTTDSQLLAKPQLRISEGEAATLHIGRRVPLPVSTFTSANPAQGGTFAPVTSYSYSDVGIKISIEPRVHHNREVTLKLKVEVSDIAGFAPDTNPPQPIIGTRTIESVIRLKDGETNFLAGLIREDDADTTTQTPFLGDIPLIGRLFNHEVKDFARTDLVLTMTPHIIRIADITEDDLAPMWVGTGDNLTFRGSSPRIQSQAPGDPFAPTPTQFTPPPPVPQMQPGTPAVTVPVGQPPTDIFSRPTPPPAQNSPLEPETPPQPYPPPGGMASNGVDSAAVASAAALMLAPRIAPQPIELALGIFEERIWTLVGMDLAGMTTDEVLLHFNAHAVDILEAQVGSAVQSDPVTPAAVVVDNGNGTVRLNATDGGPLRFHAGGEILTLRVRGLAEGMSYLVLSDLDLRSAAGEAVEAVVQGGRIAIQ